MHYRLHFCKAHIGQKVQQRIEYKTHQKTYPTLKSNRDSPTTKNRSTHSDSKEQPMTAPFTNPKNPTHNQLLPSEEPRMFEATSLLPNDPETVDHLTTIGNNLEPREQAHNISPHKKTSHRRLKITCHIDEKKQVTEAKMSVQHSSTRAQPPQVSHSLP